MWIEKWTENKVWYVVKISVQNLVWRRAMLLCDILSKYLYFSYAFLYEVFLNNQYWLLKAQ